MDKPFAGRVILITGASRGLGRALALGAADRGASLVLCARGAADLALLVELCRERGAETLAVTADLGEPRDVERLASLAFNRFGIVDTLVNNASTLGHVPLRHLADASAEALLQTMRINVEGPLRLTQAVLGGMLLRGRGLVVNISSDAAVTGYPGWGLYGSSKAALDALTRSFSAELAGTGVRVLSVDPGDMDTQMHRDAVPDADPAGLARPEAVAECLLALLAGELPELDRVEAAAL